MRYPVPPVPPSAIPFDDLELPGEADGHLSAPYADAPPPDVEFDDLGVQTSTGVVQDDHDHGHGHDLDAPGAAPGTPTAPPPKPPKPHQRDPNYRALQETRDILMGIARKPYVDRLKVDSALGAAKIAAEMIDLFGVEAEETDDAIEAAAVAAGREAARRAVNTGLFGAQTPVQPGQWITPPGDTAPRRQGQ